jgi:hypothetical protein
MIGGVQLKDPIVVDRLHTTPQPKGRTMKRSYLIHAAIAASVAAAVVHGKWVTTEAQAQAAQAQTRSLPTFDVDKSWPKLPPQYKLGDVSAMASDAQGNIYVLHRPRTLKDPDFAMAAPPVVVFDTTAISCAPGVAMARAMNGRSASTASTSTTRAWCGSAATTARATASHASSPWPTINC